MKKTGFLVLLSLVSTLSLFASPSWIGVHRIGWRSDQTATATHMGSSSTSSGIEEGIGLVISGSLYPDAEYPYGLGFQLGAVKTTEGWSSTESHDPLVVRGVITSLYGTDISESLFLEFGSGILYERLTDTYSDSGIETHITVKSFSFYSSSSLALRLVGSLSLVGGISIALPLFSTAEKTSGGITIKPDLHVTGYTFEALIGIAINI